VGDPALSKVSRGVWGWPFCSFAPLLAGLPVALCVGAYYVGDASIHARLLVSIYMVRFLLIPTYTVPI
jgi:hypothetical protein